MDNRIKKIINESKCFPEFSLPDSIFGKIEFKKNKDYKIKSYGYSLSFLISLALLIPTLSNLINKLSDYGFSDYLSLLVYDFEVISSYWKDFFLSLVNTIPTTSLILSLLLIFVSVFSLIRLSKFLRINFKTV